MRRLLFLFAALLVVASSAWATTPTFDAASSLGNGSANSLTFTHTTSGTNRYLACGTATQDASVTVSSVTFNGVALSQLAVLDNTTDVTRQSRVEHWYLVNPPAATASVVVSFSGVTAVAAGCVSYTNVHQSTPHGTPASMKGDSTAISVDVASAVGEVVLDATAIRVGTTTITAGAGQTERVERQSAAGIGNTTIGMSSEDGASTTTMSWGVDDSPPGTPATAKAWATLGVSLKGIATVAGSTLTVCASGCTYTALRPAIQAAACGDEILTEKAVTLFDSTFGEYVLPPKCDGTYTTIRTGVTSTGALIPASEFPADGVRVIALNDPRGRPPTMCGSVTCDGFFTKIRANVNNQNGIRTIYPGETGAGTGCAAAPCIANYWKLKYLQFVPYTPWVAGAMVQLGTDGSAAELPNGNSQNLRSEIPHHFIIEQNLFTGDPVRGQHRCMSIHANYVTVKDNSFVLCIRFGNETSAVWGLNAEGPGDFINNTISGSGMSLFTGGGNPTIAGKATIAASPTPTATVFTLSNVTDLIVNQVISVVYGGVEKACRVIGMSGLQVTVEPGCLPSAPDVPGDVDWTLSIGGWHLYKNDLVAPLSWRDDWLAQPAGITVTPFTSGGSLANGTYCYRVAARLDAGNSGMITSRAPAQICNTISGGGGAGRMVISWNAVTNITPTYGGEFRVYGRSSGSFDRFFTVTATTAPSFSYTDTGTGGTLSAGQPTDDTAPFAPDTGSHPSVKNRLEFKECDGRGVAGQCIVEGNWIEGSWLDGQNGSCVLFKNTNQDGNHDSAVTRYVRMSYNVIKSCNRAIEICSTDCQVTPSGRFDDFILEHTLMLDIGATYGFPRSALATTSGTGGPNFILNRGGDNWLWDHLTILQDPANTYLMLVDVDPWNLGINDELTGFTFRNLLTRRGGITDVTTTGFRASNVGGTQAEGTTSWNIAQSGGTWAANFLADASCGSYPAGTTCPSEATFEAYFVNYAACVAAGTTDVSGCAVSPSSAAHNAGTDGHDVGADIATLKPLVDIAISGNNSDGATPGVHRSRFRLRIRG